MHVGLRERAAGGYRGAAPEERPSPVLGFSGDRRAVALIAVAGAIGAAIVTLLPNLHGNTAWHCRMTCYIH